MMATGQQLFQQFGCQACHKVESGQRGPSLEGLFGSEVKLVTGQTVVADQEYIRESILNPSAKTVAGYLVLMPRLIKSVEMVRCLRLQVQRRRTRWIVPQDAVTVPDTVFEFPVHHGPLR